MHRTHPHLTKTKTKTNETTLGQEPTAPWGLRGSPPQNYDDRPGELATASEQGRPEVVVLIEALSSPSRPVRRLFELAKAWPVVTECEASATTRCRTARQLRPTEIDELATAYQAGATVFELAARFEIHRTTVGRLLRERGIDTRPPALETAALPKLTQLYEDGRSIANIAQHYGVSKNAVRDRLLSAGVTLRSRGWPKKVAG